MTSLFKRYDDFRISKPGTIFTLVCGFLILTMCVVAPFETKKGLTYTLTLDIPLFIMSIWYMIKAAKRLKALQKQSSAA